MRAKTKVYLRGIDVDRRLAELSLTRAAILAIRDVACSMSATGASPFFPSNGAGTLAYQFGTRELRAQLDPLGWVIDRSYGTQGVRLPEQPIVILYQNVDMACSLADLPSPRTKKGAGSERLSQGHMFSVVEEEIPSTYSGESSIELEVWYVMVSETGAVEVTHAVVANGEFRDLIERIFVSDGSDLDIMGHVDAGGGDDAVSFDVVIERR